MEISLDRFWCNDSPYLSKFFYNFVFQVRGRGPLIVENIDMNHGHGSHLQKQNKDSIKGTCKAREWVINYFLSFSTFLFLICCLFLNEPPIREFSSPCKEVNAMELKASCSATTVICPGKEGGNGRRWSHCVHCSKKETLIAGQMDTYSSWSNLSAI